jgi:hypothetical protein
MKPSRLCRLCMQCTWYSCIQLCCHISFLFRQSCYSLLSNSNFVRNDYYFFEQKLFRILINYLEKENLNLKDEDQHLATTCMTLCLRDSMYSQSRSCAFHPPCPCPPPTMDFLRVSKLRFGSQYLLFSLSKYTARKWQVPT